MSNRLLSVILSVFVGFSLAGCNSGDGRLRETADLEGKIAAEAELKAENDNLARRSSEMEQDLSVRQRFYQGVRGTYEGTLRSEKGSFSVRFTLVPSLPPFSAGRIRAPEEVVHDLNSLHLNVQVIQWNPANKLSAVGCRFERIRPDLTTGEIHLAAESCPNLYAVRIGETPLDGTLNKVEAAESSQVASMLLEGKIERIGRISGKMQPTTNAAVFSIDAIRSEE